MKNIIKYILGFAMVFYGISCVTDFMNVNRRIDFQEKLFEEPGLVGAFVNDMYRGLNHGIRELCSGPWRSSHNLSIIMDQPNWFDRTLRQLMSAVSHGGNLMSSIGLYFSSGAGKLTCLRNRLKQLHLTMPSRKESFIGEVHFLNTYYYHNLVRFTVAFPWLKAST